MSNDFNELVSKLFSCNIILLSTEESKQFCKNKFNTNLENVLNQFSIINKLNRKSFFN